MRGNLIVGWLVLAAALSMSVSGQGTKASTSKATTKPAAKSTTKSTASKTAKAKASTSKASATKAKTTTAKNTKSKSKAKSTAKTTRTVARRSTQQQPTQDRFKEIQQALYDKGYYAGPVDGVWGPDATTALKRFQHDQSLVEDGKLGALSLIALGLGPRRDPRPDARVEAASAQATPDTAVPSEVPETPGLQPSEIQPTSEAPAP